LVEGRTAGAAQTADGARLVGIEEVQRWPEEAGVRHTEVLTQFIEGGELWSAGGILQVA